MYQKVKGTYDLLPKDTAKWIAVERAIRNVSKLFNYKEIRTPIFEKTELFHRSVGDSSDIVSKETYDFLDRGNRSITLRPEGTAGVVRSYIENKIYAEPSSISKMYYMGPIFRYERPQKGRYRQFSQFGAEMFGSNSPMADAEVISYAVSILKSLKINDVTVHINSLGDKESKMLYREALVKHLAPDIDNLCSDCQKRYQNNPLRILDCKVDQENELLLNAPSTIDYLTSEDKNHFDSVLAYLDVMKVDYVVDKNLVRGLDYYTNTVFEIKTSLANLGAQNTICGGGRYNNLVSDLSGPATPAVGFAFGFERLLLVLEALEYKGDIDYTHLFIIGLGESVKEDVMQMTNRCRMGGLITETDLNNKNLKQQFKQSEINNARFIAIYGENEKNEGKINLKDKQNNTEVTIDKHQLYNYVVAELMKPAQSSCSSCGEEDSCDTCGGE